MSWRLVIRFAKSAAGWDEEIVVDGVPLRCCCQFRAGRTWREGAWLCGSWRVSKDVNWDGEHGGECGVLRDELEQCRDAVLHPVLSSSTASELWWSWIRRCPSYSTMGELAPPQVERKLRELNVVGKRPGRWPAGMRDRSDYLMVEVCRVHATCLQQSTV